MVVAAENIIGVITYSDEIEEQITGLQEQVNYYRDLYNDLYKQYSFITHLFESDPDKLTTGHKATIQATVRYLRDHDRDRDERGYIKMNAWDVAHMAGHTYSTVLNHWGVTSREIRIHEGTEVEADIGRVPIFDRMVVRVPTTDRETYPQGYYLETYIKERDILYQPDHYKAMTEVEWGGKRKNAGRKKCGKCNVWMKVKDHTRTMQREHICPNCHDHLWDEVIRISDDEPPTPGTDNDNSDAVNEPVERANASKNHLDFCYPEPINEAENILDEVAPVEGSKRQLDEVYPSPLHLQDAVCSPDIEQEQKQESPITAPPIAEHFTMEGWLQKRIGHGPLIYSTGKMKEPKYITHDIEYVPDLQAYLDGHVRHLYGSRPALPDGSTWLLGFDKDTYEPSLQGIMETLAKAGAAPVYWKRRPGRGHLEVYFDQPVDRRAAYAWVVSVCPALALIPEAFPIGSDQNEGGSDRSDYGYSWPLWYRVGNMVIECAVDFAFPDKPGGIIQSEGIKTHRNSLPWLISRAVTPASLIPALPVVEMEQEAPGDRGVLLDIPRKRESSYYDDGLRALVLAEYERKSWDEVVNGKIDGDRFCASWRTEQTSSVTLNKDGRTASDRGRTQSGRIEVHDKFDVYWLTRDREPRTELKRLIDEHQERLIDEYRQQQERKAS